MDDLEMKRQIEFMVSKFQEFVAKFHDLEEGNKQLLEENKSLKNEILSNTSLILSNHDKIQGNQSRLEDVRQWIKNSSEDLCKLSEELKSYKLHNDNTLKSHSLSLNALDQNIQESIKDHEDTKVNLKKYFDTVNCQLVNMLDFESKFKNLGSEVEKVKSSFVHSNDCHQKNSIEIDLMRRDLNRVTEQQFDQYKKDLSIVNDSIVSMKKSEEMMMKTLNDKIDSIKIPSVEGFFRKEDIDSLTRDLESIRLDAKNAYLKCSNSDTQVQIIKKQVENLQLQVKSNDLNK